MRGRESSIMQGKEGRGERIWIEREVRNCREAGRRERSVRDRREGTKGREMKGRDGEMGKEKVTPACEA